MGPNGSVSLYVFRKGAGPHAGRAFWTNAWGDQLRYSSTGHRWELAWTDGGAPTISAPTDCALPFGNSLVWEDAAPGWKYLVGPVPPCSSGSRPITMLQEALTQTIEACYRQCEPFVSNGQPGAMLVMVRDVRLEFLGCKVLAKGGSLEWASRDSQQWKLSCTSSGRWPITAKFGGKLHCDAVAARPPWADASWRNCEDATSRYEVVAVLPWHISLDSCAKLMAASVEQLEHMHLRREELMAKLEQLQRQVDDLSAVIMN